MVIYKEFFNYQLPPERVHLRKCIQIYQPPVSSHTRTVRPGWRRWAVIPSCRVLICSCKSGVGSHAVDAGMTWNCIHIFKKTSYLFRRHSLSSMTLDLTDIQRMCELRCVNFTCRNTSWLCLNTWFHHVRKENENSMQLRVMMIAYVTGVDMAITCNYCVPFLTHAGIQDERTRALAAQAFLGG